MRKQRRSRRLQVEALEGKVVLSSVAGESGLERIIRVAAEASAAFARAESATAGESVAVAESSEVSDDGGTRNRGRGRAVGTLKGPRPLAIRAAGASRGDRGLGVLTVGGPRARGGLRAVGVSAPEGSGRPSIFRLALDGRGLGGEGGSGGGDGGGLSGALTIVSRPARRGGAPSMRVFLVGFGGGGGGSR